MKISAQGKQGWGELLLLAALLESHIAHSLSTPHRSDTGVASLATHTGTFQVGEGEGRFHSQHHFHILPLPTQLPTGVSLRQCTGQRVQDGKCCDASAVTVVVFDSFVIGLDAAAELFSLTAGLQRCVK